MAVSSALLQRLNGDEDFCDRLTLAKNVFLSYHLPIPNRREIITAWISDCIENSKSPSTEEYLLLWTTFSEIIKLYKEEVIHPIALRSSFSEVIIKQMQNYNGENSSVIAIVLTCSKTILESSSLNYIFTRKFKCMLSLLSSILNVLCVECAKSKNLPVFQCAKEVTIIILNSLKEVQKRQMNKNKISCSFIQVLEPISIILYLTEVRNVEKELQYLCDRLVNQVVKSLLQKEITTIYEELAQMNADESKMTDECRSYVNFFKKIQELLCEQLTVFDVMMNTAASVLVKRLVMEFLDDVGMDAMHRLHVVALLCAVVGINVPIRCSDNLIKFDLKPPQIEPTIQLMVVENILQACAAHPEHFNSLTIIKGKLNPVEWLKNLARVLLAMENKDSQVQWFGCFRIMLDISSTVLESNITLIIKHCWLQIDIVTSAAERQYTSLFTSLLSTYCQLRQIPKLVSKFFSAIDECLNEMSGGRYLCSGHIFSAVLEGFGKCIDVLPVGQMLELWKIFRDAYEKFRILRKNISAEGYSHVVGALNLTSQLYSKFLEHARVCDNTIPPGMQCTIKNLMEDTRQLISNSTDFLTFRSFEDCLLACSFLTLCHARGQIEIAYRTSKNIDQTEWQNLEDVECLVDFSVLHSYFSTEKQRSTLQSFLERDNAILRYLGKVKMLVQKVKALIIRGKLNTDEKKHIVIITSFLFKSAVVNYQSADSDWNFELWNLNQHNYCTALWSILLDYLPYLISYVSLRELSLFCSALVDILVEEEIVRQECLDKKNMQVIVYEFVTSSRFAEIKTIQTAFVTALWKRSSTLFQGVKRLLQCTDIPVGADCILNCLCKSQKNWNKFSGTTPKCSEDGKTMNKMWLNVKEAATYLNNWLQVPIFEKRKLKINDSLLFMKIVKQLPLHNLLPGNQMRCLLGLSVLLLHLSNCCNEEDASELLKLAEEIFKALIDIFEGVRSIWLFDFVDVKSFLRAVVCTLVSLIELKRMKVNSNSWYSAKRFLEHLFELCMINTQSLLCVKDYTNELTSHITGSQIPNAVALSVVIILKRLVLLFQRPYLKQNYKELCQNLATVICSAVVQCVKASEVLKSQECSTEMQSFLLQSYICVIELTTNSACDINETTKQNWMKLLSVFVSLAMNTLKYSKDESAIDVSLSFITKMSSCYSNLGPYVPENFVISYWKALMSHINRKTLSINGVCSDISKDLKTRRNSFRTTLQLHLHMLPKCDLRTNAMNHTAVEECNETNMAVDRTLVVKISECNLDNLVVLNDSEVSAIISVIKISSSEETDLIFQQFIKEMDDDSADNTIINIPLFQMRLNVLKLIINNIFEKCKKKIMCRYIQKLLTTVHCIMNQTSENPLYHFLISIPSLNFISCVLKIEKNYLSRQTIIQCLHSCATTQIEIYVEKPSLFIKVFTSLWTVLNELLVHHLYAVLSSRATFVKCASMLLKSIVQAADQDLILLYDTSVHQDILHCAQNLNRLLTSLSQQKVEFAKLVPFLVADYINCIQNVTVHPSVKVHILAGIYRVLDICSEHSLDMLAVCLGYGCREIFKQLLNNYKKHHQYHGHV